MESWQKALIFVGVYMAIGLMLFEWAWSQVKPIRNVDEDRDSKYPAFRRRDAINWRKWKFYPGALIMLPLRLVFTFTLLLICYLCTKVLTICYRFTNDQPMTGWRQTTIRYIYQFLSGALMNSISMYSTRKKVDFDYTEYLGEGYKESTPLPERVSTLVCNHQTWVDTTMLFQYFRHSFVSKKSVINAPVMGIVGQAMGCVFIPRGASQEIRDGIVAQIGERQRLAEEDHNYPPFVIFPEGGTSNGTCLLPFKRGAFSSGRAIRPVVMKITYSDMSPCYDITPFVPLVFMNLCQLYAHFEIFELPPFKPNDFLYQNHAGKVTVSSSQTEAPLTSIVSPREKEPFPDGPNFTGIGSDGKPLKVSPTEDLEAISPEGISTIINAERSPSPPSAPEKWEIFAWAVRDVMSRASGLQKSEQQYRDKLQYEEILGYRQPSKGKYEQL